MMKMTINSTIQISTLILCVLFTIVTLPLCAQRSPEILEGVEAQRMVANSEMVRINLATQTPSFVKFEETNAPALQNLSSVVEKTFKVDKDYQLNLIRSEKDQIGYEHFRFQQSYQGVPIEGGVLIVHVKEGKVMSMNGQFSSKIDVSTRPTLSEQACFSNALQNINADQYMWELLEEQSHLKTHDAYIGLGGKPKGELFILDKNLGTDKTPQYHLVYKFDIYANEPHQRIDIFVDANNGEIIKKYDKICQHSAHDRNADMTEEPACHEHHAAEVNFMADEVGTAETAYSGNRSMTADNTGSGATPYRLFESTRNISTKNLNGNAEYTDNDNAWTIAEMGADQYAMDCHWGTEKTYDYYLNAHGRNSFDNNGALIQSFLNSNGSGAVNAFWNGASLNYGSGSGAITPLTTLDVVGHEFTHAVTTNSAGLIYSYESGALNESFSDIFGVTIEFYAKPPNGVGNWTLGEEANFIIRDMSNPNAYSDPDTYLGTHWHTSSSDNGGVHTNSGVQNYWFYLLTDGGTGTNDNSDSFNVVGIGMDDAAAIAYRSLTVYLSSSSNYADARFYSIVAAKELFGGCPISQQIISTTDAWHAVGVGAVYQPDTLSMDISANNNISCTAPTTVHFNALQLTGIADPATVIWDFGDGGVDTGLSVSHTYLTLDSFTVTLNASDCAGTPITSVIKSDFVILNDNPCVMNMPTTGNREETTCTGILRDDGGTGDYSANLNSIVTLHSANGTQVTLNFLSFDFELNYDYLNIYDGPNTSSPLIGSYTGSALPNGGLIHSTDSSITIQQLTDPFVEESGFELSWVSESDGDAVAGASCGGTDCDDTDPNVSISCGSCVDMDGDGYYTGCDLYITVDGPDCNDSDSLINPGAVEICNGIDDDCDMIIDDGFAQDYFFDGDGDGYGDGSPLNTCDPPTHYVLLNGDCNDSDSLIHPGAMEICNGIDDDCNMVIDDGFAQDYFFDGDGDGYGGGAPLFTCTPPLDYILVGGDCNDSDSLIYPGASEVCNGIDDNCDDVIDIPSVATYASANVPIAISSAGTPTVTSTLTISGYTGNIIDLNVKNLHILHTYVGDLSATLTSPSDSVFILFNRPVGCFQDNILVSFNDSDSLTATDFVNTCNPSTSLDSNYAINGSYQPATLLSALNGTSPNGTWTLTVSDAAGADGGSIEGWGLEISTDESFVCCAEADSILYVNGAATGLNNGLSWTNAYNDLQSALADTNLCATEIWVAAGTYKPTAGTDRWASFDLKNNFAIYGGFAGTESSEFDLNMRDFQLNESILSGKIGGPDSTDNSYTIVVGINADSTAVFDGFTIANAYGEDDFGFPSDPARGGGMHLNGGNPILKNLVFDGNTAQFGGGIYLLASRPTISRCRFVENRQIWGGYGGGGIMAEGASSPVIEACTFERNYGYFGGGVYFSGGDPQVDNCHFIGNNAVYGGAIANVGGTTARINNCLVRNNTASVYGGGVANYAAATLTNCTVSSNQSVNLGGGIYNESVAPTITNCIVWGNSTGIEGSGTPMVTYSIVQGGYAGTGNLDVDPRFVDTVDLRPLPCSPAIDKGNNLSNILPFDIQGHPRIFNATGATADTIDIGAYEMPTDNTLSTMWTGLGDSILWTDANNWSDGFIPQPCRDIIIPSGTVTVPAGYTAEGKTLEVITGAQLETENSAVMDIEN
jgi:Zn-dependent metalloprotease/subtilisin-like proprotein convertase family protein